jgi:ISXO2 transposase-like protein/transposase-like zinc ribbon protein
MAARKRDSVKPSPSSESQMTYSRFLELFPDNAACLEYLKERFFPAGTECPGCEKKSRFHRIKGRSAYSCQYCGHHVYPTAGTIFHKSTTSLQLWFWAIYLMSSTRCGISAKQLEREIGVTYKTAHRMFKQIRTLLGADGDKLSGKVEMDETGYGGKPRLADDTGDPVKRRNWIAANKTSVFAMVERKGRVRAMVVPDRSMATLQGAAREYVLPASMIFTDEWPLYKGLGKHFAGHRRIKHKEKVYVDGDVHTQTVEGFFALVKTGISGVYHSVSRRYLQSYLDEYAWRYNQRGSATPMFWSILGRVRKVDLASS